MPHESHRVQGESSISVSFPPFRFDLRTDQLWRGASLIPLSHKAGQVLHCLVRRPGALVLKQEILDAVWPNTFVTEGVLKVHVVEIRRALGDTVDDPKYIRTVYGRGYEFLAGGDVSPTRRHEPTGRLLDRQREMDTLAHYFAQSLDGRTGVVFVTGAAGVGKTALLQAFLALVKNHPAVRLIQGRSHGCLSAGEPFFPVLDALNDLFRQPGSESLLEYVRQCAPTWLSQLPWLQSETDRRLLRRSTLGAAPGRMLREFAQLLCHVNSKHVLVFALEDLHWADGATLDLIRFLATGSRDLRLLLIGLVRSDRETAASPAHDLCLSLTMGSCADQISLAALSEAGVAQYIDDAWPNNSFPHALPHLVYRKTGGNPLFLVNLARHLSNSGQIAHEDGAWTLAADAVDLVIDAPFQLSRMIERTLDHLTQAERRVVEAASVLGYEFSPALLAALIEEPPTDVEAVCARLTRLRVAFEPSEQGERVGGTRSQRYRFAHEFYHQVAYAQVPASRRLDLHRACGHALERLGRDGLAVTPAELGRHFEGAGEWLRAFESFLRAASDALRACAPREALRYLERASELIARLAPDQQTRMRTVLLEARGAIHLQSANLDAAIGSFMEMVAAARAGQDPDSEVRALVRVSQACFLFDHSRCLATADEAVRAARAARPVVALMASHHCDATELMLSGWDDGRFRACSETLSQLREAGDPEFLVRALASFCVLQAYQSDYAAACRTADEGMARALEIGDTYSYVTCQYFKGWSLVHSGDWGAAQRLLRDALTTCQRNDHFPATCVLELLIARLHAEVADFEGALRVTDRLGRAPSAGLARHLYWITVARAQAGLGDLHAALEACAELTREPEQAPVRIDWLHRLTLQHVLADLHVHRGDVAAGEAAATHLIEMARRSGETTYERLGLLTLVELDWVRGWSEEARVRLESLLRAAAEDRTPLADWRILHIATCVAGAEGRTREAARLRRQRAAVLSRMSGSIEPGDALRSGLERLANMSLNDLFTGDALFSRIRPASAASI